MVCDDGKDEETDITLTNVLCITSSFSTRRIRGAIQGSRFNCSRG